MSIFLDFYELMDQRVEGRIDRMSNVFLMFGEQGINESLKGIHFYNYLITRRHRVLSLPM